MKAVDALMHRAVEQGVFPGAVLLAARYEKILYHEAVGCLDGRSRVPVTRHTVYDLASLTKPLATAPALMHMTDRGVLSPEKRLGDLLEPLAATDKAQIRIRHLLCHNAGLPAYRPYYRRLLQVPPGRRKYVLREMLAAEPLRHPPGTRTTYSDIGYMILQWVIEAVSGLGLDRYVRKHVYGPLEIGDLFFPSGCGRGQRVSEATFAPTEETAFGRLTAGRVHDENAAALGGICGHAGLFGTASAVFALLLDLLLAFSGRRQSRVWSRPVVERFLSVPEGACRAMGFDVPSSEDSSSGRCFTPGRTVGHLGFTGVSFWMDLAEGITVVLLTNRVCPSRQNRKIAGFRPRLHDTVMKHLKG